MTKPVRLQLSRKKGFNLQEHSRAVNGLEAVNVARPSIFGNPFTKRQAQEVGYSGSNSLLVEAFSDWISGGDTYWQGAECGWARSRVLNNISALRGKNLACWCKSGEPCHADVLLELANGLKCEVA